MTQLLKLEWKKNKLSKSLLTVGIIIITVFVVSVFMALASNNQEESMFTDYASFMSLTNIFIRITFVIFSGVLLSRLVVDEYKNKTIQILFTYPINRKKVMKSKLLLVVVFCFVSILVATLIISFLTLGFNPILHIFPKVMTVKDIIVTIPNLMMTTTMTACLSLIPLYFGLKKQSSATTITTAVLIGFLVNATVSNGVNLGQMMIIPIILSVIGLLVGYLAYYKVETKDIN